jgi:hypothetical protein
MQVIRKVINIKNHSCILSPTKYIIKYKKKDLKIGPN